MKLCIIAAIDHQRVIGYNGKLPWHISEDLKRFKRLTSGHAVIMGRKTYESLGKPLPNRRNIVISSKPLADIESYTSIEEALQSAHDEEKVFIIGGGTIYRQTLAKADEIFLTIVEGSHEGDTYFPEYEPLLSERFKLTNRELHNGFVFEDYVKK